MCSDEVARARICGERYRQRRADGKLGWADEDAYVRKYRAVDELFGSGDLPSHCRFLELGCGNGNIAIHAARQGHEAHGVDLAPEAIEWARQQAQQQALPAQFVVGSVVTLSPYADCYFDLVFDANCLFMILGADRKICVASVFRVLKHGGRFFAEAHLVDAAIQERLALSGEDYFDPVGQFSTVRGHPMYYFSTREEFVNLVQGCGFEIVRCWTEPKPVTSRNLPFWAGEMIIDAVKP